MNRCESYYFFLFWIRDSFGDSAISGDLRWAGSYGVNVDFVARSHCAVEVILVEDLEVSVRQSFRGRLFCATDALQLKTSSILKRAYLAILVDISLVFLCSFK